MARRRKDIKAEWNVNPEAWIKKLRSRKDVYDQGTERQQYYQRLAKQRFNEVTMSHDKQLNEMIRVYGQMFKNANNALFKANDEDEFALLEHERDYIERMRVELMGREDYGPNLSDISGKARTTAEAMHIARQLDKYTVEATTKRLHNNYLKAMRSQGLNKSLRGLYNKLKNMSDTEFLYTYYLAGDVSTVFIYEKSTKGEFHETVAYDDFQTTGINKLIDQSENQIAVHWNNAMGLVESYMPRRRLKAMRR